MPMLGESLLLSVLGIELDCATELLVVLVEPGTTREMIGPVLVRVVMPATVVRAVKEHQVLMRAQSKISTRRS